MSTTVSLNSKTTSSLNVHFSSNYYGANVFDIYLNGTYQTTISGTNDGTGYYYCDYNYTGLSTSTSYNCACHVFLSGTDVEQGTGTYTTDSPPSPPSGTPSVSASAVSGHQLFVSWSTVSGATGYDVYADGFYKTSSSGTSMTISVDKEYWNYSIAVYPYNSAGTGSAGTTTCRSLDETDPTTSSVTQGTVTATSVQVTASGYDNAPTSGNMSGLSGFYFYKNGTYVGSAYQSGGSASYNFTGLTTGTAYTLGAQAFDVQGNTSSIVTISATPAATRPANFSWTNSKSSGGNFNLSAAEWNAFTTRINDFRQYKGLTVASFTSASTGNNFTAAMFNEAVNAINAMTPPTTPPSTKSAGNDIYASYLNDIVTSLNSIT